VTDEHLSLDELAEFDEGLLDPERASEVQAHLDSCAECRALLASITSTRELLANLPEEEMPADVIARLDRALAEDSPGTTTVVPQLDTYRRRRLGHPTMAASAAAAVLVLAGGAIVIGILSHPSSSSGGGSGGSSTAAVAEPSQPSTYVRTSTGTDYTPSSLIAQVPSLVANVTEHQRLQGSTSGSAVPSPTVPSAGAFTVRNAPVPTALRPLFRSRAKLLECAATLTGFAGTIPIAVDFGRWTFESYRKEPAAVFIFKDPDPSVVDVYVTSPVCNSSSILTYIKVPLQQ
jgi:hypothetical protein